MKDSPYFDAGTAASFDRLAVPFQFLPPARDLVAMLKLHPGSLVFDVGAGTGAATIRAMAAVGLKGLVVGLDPSVEMLRRLQRKGACPVVVAKAPGLPFPDGLFDALANFVLSHFNNYAGALADMVRVLRPGGQMGVTTWTAFKQRVAAVFQDRFPDTVEYVRDVHFGIGMKPAV